MTTTKTKRCTCCQTSHDAASWAALPYVGIQVFDAEPEFGLPEVRLEMRNCQCGSTLTVKEAA